MLSYILQYDPSRGFYHSTVASCNADCLCVRRTLSAVNSSPVDSIVEITQKEHELNSKLESGRLHAVKCKQCNAWYMLSNRQIEWYTARSLAIPKRCPDCIVQKHS